MCNEYFVSIATDPFSQNFAGTCSEALVFDQAVFPAP